MIQLYKCCRDRIETVTWVVPWYESGFSGWQWWRQWGMTSPYRTRTKQLFLTSLQFLVIYLATFCCPWVVVTANHGQSELRDTFYYELKWCRWKLYGFNCYISIRWVWWRHEVEEYVRITLTYSEENATFLSIYKKSTSIV